MKLNRRTFGQALAATAAVGSVTRVHAASKNIIRFGTLFTSDSTLAYGIAEQIGAYNGKDFLVQTERFTSGQSADGIQALVTGNLDIYYGGGPETPRLNSHFITSGSPPPLAVISASNPGLTNLVLGNKLHPKSFDELVGKPLRIGVTSPSSIHLATLRGWLKRYKQMTTQQLGWQFLTIDGGSMPPALLTDQIDGFMHSEPTTSIAILNKAGWLFMAASRGDFGPKWPTTFMVASRSFLKNNGDLVRSFMKATQTTNDYYKHCSKQQAVGIISKWMAVSPQVSASAYERIDPTIGLSHDQAQLWWDFVGTSMVDRGEVSKQVVPFRDIFDLSYQ